MRNSNETGKEAADMSTEKKSRPFNNMEMASICSQLALILKSGISLLEGISIMLEDADTEEEQRILQTLLDEVMMHGSLNLAMETVGLFPAYAVQMVKIGEETGTLDEVMQALADHYEREDSISKGIRQAVTYPLLMAGLMVLVIVVLLIKVMPIFNQVFMQLGTEMTGFSRVLMNMGNVLSRYSVVFAAILIVIVLAILVGTRTQKGRAFFHHLGYRIGVTRPMMERTAACRFASGMALTLASGLDPERSLELVGSLNDDPDFQKKLENCKERLAGSEELSTALTASGIFSGMYSRMIAIGGRTGSMDQVMKQIADLYQDEMDDKMNRAIAVLEPTLVIALSLVVGVILLSVMLPLMGILSSL